MNAKTNLISGLFLIFFLCVAAATAIAGVWQGRAEAKADNIESIIQGKWSSVYEDVFNKKIFVYEWCKNGWGIANYFLFKEGNEGVLIGEDNWLFTKEEFDYSADINKQLEEKVDFIAAVQNHMAKKNTALLIAPIPAKARIYKDNLGRYSFPSYKEKVYKDFISHLANRGISAVDILTPMTSYEGDSPLFIKTDTHWTPEGAGLAAKEIASYIEENMDIPYERGRYKSVKETTRTYDGDLSKYIPLGPLSSRLGLEPVQLISVKTLKIDESESAIAAEDALFSNSTPAITLVGTSYSANPIWNFEGYLKEYLKTDVLNSAQEGLGPFETMKKYLKDDAFLETPPKLVIWEIPERYLTFDYDLSTEFYAEKTL